MKKEKQSYETYEEAFEHLQHIVETSHKPWKKKDNLKPCRVYEEGGLFYLTSKPKTW